MSFNNVELNFPHSSTKGYFWKKLEASYLSFDLSEEQFIVIQKTCSGAGLGVTIESCLSFMKERGKFLQGQEDEDGNIGEYCAYGAFVGDVEEKEDEKILAFWYETTSGTILLVFFSEEGDAYFSVFLPCSREGGVHHQHIKYALAGRTLDMYNRWYNSYLELHTEDGRTRHQEEIDFHNTHMVPEGCQPILNVSQIVRQRRMDKILRSIHGEWSEKYGIGRHLSDLLGYPPGEPLKGKQAVKLAKKIQGELKEALEAWTGLIESGEFE